MNPTTTNAVAVPAMRLNLLLYWLTALAAILTLASSGMALIPAVIDQELLDLATGAGATDMTILTSTRIVAFLIYLAHDAVLAWGLFAAAELFRRLARGEAFTPRSGLLLRRFGCALLAHMLLAPVVDTALIGAATWHGPGEHMLSISLGLSNDGVLLSLMAALLIALGHVLLDAARLAEDHRQIV